MGEGTSNGPPDGSVSLQTRKRPELSLDTARPSLLTPQPETRASPLSAPAPASGWGCTACSPLTYLRLPAAHEGGHCTSFHGWEYRLVQAHEGPQSTAESSGPGDSGVVL